MIDKIESWDKLELYEKLVKNKDIIVELDGEKIKLNKDDFEIIEKEKEHVTFAEVEGMDLFLDTTMTPELEAEGFAREIVRRIQSMRKELDLDVEDRISTEIKVDSDRKEELQRWADYIKGETRSKKITFPEVPSGKLVKKWKIDELKAEIGIDK